MSHHPAECVSADDIRDGSGDGGRVSAERRCGGERAGIDYDLIIRDGTLVLPTGEIVGDIGVQGKVITAIGEQLGGTARAQITASGLHVLPGGIDVHVHLNDPGRADWEGVDSGTRALVAGGVTTLCDMPLNSVPATVDGRAFDAKRNAYDGRSWIDYAFWGGLIPGGGTHLEELYERGAIGVKAFMASSNTPEFPSVDDLTLFEGMTRCAELGLIVAVHAENADITDGLAARVRGSGGKTASDFLSSRPPIAEIEAIARAITMAREASCSLHVVHVSTQAGLDLVADARRGGVDVTCETCPQYLTFSADDLERLGVGAKCQPPLRTVADQRALWQFLRGAPEAIVASDHSPAPANLRLEDDFLGSWGGIAGAQTTLPAILTRWPQGALPPSNVARVFAANPAERFGFFDRGRLDIGYRADIAICDLAVAAVFARKQGLSRDKSSPFIGECLHAQVRHTIVAGQVVWSDGAVLGEQQGQFLRPRRQS